MAVSDPTLNSADELRTYRQPADHVGSYWGAHVVLFVLFVAALGLAAFTPKQAVVFESTTSIQMVSVLAGLMVGILVTHEILHYIAARSLGFEAAFVIAKIPGVPLVNPAVRLNATGRTCLAMAHHLRGAATPNDCSSPGCNHIFHNRLISHGCNLYHRRATSTSVRAPTT